MTTEKELGKALKEDRDTITIEGDLARKVFKIHATGKVAWVIAYGAITVAIASVISEMVTVGADSPIAIPVSLVSGTAAATTLGIPVATSAISIGVAAGSASALKKLRGYNLKKISADKIVLTKQ